MELDQQTALVAALRRRTPPLDQRPPMTLADGSPALVPAQQDSGSAGVAPMIGGMVGGIPGAVATETAERAAEPFGQGLGEYAGHLLANLNPWGAKVADPQASEITSHVDVAQLAKQAAMSAALQRAQLAFHGSPHDFDTFSMGHIGEGEGAQSYGRGLYFAERPEIAENYRRNLSSSELQFDGKPPSALHEVNVHDAIVSGIHGGESLDVAIQNAATQQRTAVASAANTLASAKAQGAGGATIEFYQRHLMNAESGVSFAESLKPENVTMSSRPGRTYAVDLPENNQLLDYDKPLSEQHPDVLKKLQDSGAITVLPKHKWVFAGDSEVGHIDRVTGKKLYASLADAGYPSMSDANTSSPEVRGIGQQHAADVLRDAGIPGLRYADGSSRSSGSSGSSGDTHNFVIWDDSTIKPLAKAGNLPDLQAQLARLKALQAPEGGTP